MQKESFKKPGLINLLYSFLFIFFTFVPALAIEPKEIILRADEYRQPFRQMKVTSKLTSFHDNKVFKEATYEVLIKGNDRALVVAVDGGEKGQKVLMLNEGFWMRFPNSGRAIRITPMQRLMGDASYGDLGKMSWANDYRVVFHPEGGENKVGQTPAWRLLLSSQKKSAVYEKIDLWVNKDNFQPLQADFYLSSGKNFKRAKFGTPELKHGRFIILETTFVDMLNKKNHTVMKFQDLKEVDINDRIFNLTVFSDR